MYPANRSHNRRLSIARRVFFSALTLVTAATLTNCGREAFLVSDTTTTLPAPGSFVVQPKIDILFAEDDTGSFIEAYPQVSQQFPAFLQNLDAKGWNYRFATIPLTLDRPMTQIAASRFDPGWGSLWIPPFPNADISLVERVGSQFFRRYDQYSGFLSYGETNPNLQSAQEPGFLNIRQALINRAPVAGFLREDAMLVILALSNGQDTSGVNYCRRSDGIRVPCNDGSSESSFNFYYNEFLAVKNFDGNRIRFFSAAAERPSSSGGCQLSNAFVGTRYISMSGAILGRNYDVCTQSISTVLNRLTQDLQAIRVNFKQHYIFISSEPNPATIKVSVVRANGRVDTIPQSATNGWTYAGYLSDVYTIDEPFNQGLASGFAIELHGTAKISGDDRAQVQYRTVGGQDASG